MSSERQLTETPSCSSGGQTSTFSTSAFNSLQAEEDSILLNLRSAQDSGDANQLDEAQIKAGQFAFKRTQVLGSTLSSENDH
ncbi:hypothetical protein I204_03399 [Kwoniella mangroviensis CBS 8886]|nr:hypothetical protein I204_03399 [Kwoniella mangroviensis CBS 8886]